MLIEPRFIGLSGPVFRMPVECGKIREFAAALGAFFPEHMDGFEPSVPPTFLVTGAYLWGYWLERPGDTVFRDLKLTDRMSYDGGQDFRYFGAPIRAGETLFGQTSIEDAHQKTGRRSGDMTLIRIRTDFRDKDEVLRATWRATSVIPHETADFSPTEAPRRPPGPFMAYGETRRQFLAIERMTIAGIAAQATLPSLTMPPLTLTDIARYGFASGEDGPSHHDEAAARAIGFDTVFSIGMLHAGMLGTYASALAGPTAVRRFTSRFHAIAWPGDVLTYSGRVSEVVRADDIEQVTLELACRRGHVDICTATAVCAPVPFEAG